MQYAFNDFGIRQVAKLLGNANDEAEYLNRSMVNSSELLRCINAYRVSLQFYRNVWDPNVKSDGFKGSILEFRALRFIQLYTGFMQKRFANGTFVQIDPKDCSPLDTDEDRECSLTDDNENGFYESSSWEVRQNHC